MTVPLFNNSHRHYAAMIRGGAMAFVSLAAFDWYFLNGEYARAAEAVAQSLAHHLVG
jgi:hypothetical protein